jgi:predicted RNA binding protein YcfA (HicA-like mRNA interferase family)
MIPRVPRKIRDLLKDLHKAGFVLVDGGKGSHRKFHGKGGKVVMIVPGHDGDDAQTYLERQVQEKIKESQQ